VSGYPEAHPDAITDDPAEMERAYWADIAYLKQKVGRARAAGSADRGRCGAARAAKLAAKGAEAGRGGRERIAGGCLAQLAGPTLPPLLVTRPCAHTSLAPPTHSPAPQLDAGADFVVTQLFYDCDRYLQFVKDCR
jgi:hypothetical protein